WEDHPAPRQRLRGSHTSATRENLEAVFVLIDSRHDPQKSDLEFLAWLGKNGIPFAIVFTKSDKMGSSALHKNLFKYKKRLLQDWEELPQIFVSSSETKLGRDEILAMISGINQAWRSNK
ncbi:MAG: hypothetical protein ACPF8V_06420, partial [Luteibaculum sp.]